VGTFLKCKAKYYTFQENGRFMVRLQGSLFKTINTIDINRGTKFAKYLWTKAFVQRSLPTNPTFFW
jgi:hypothetical protein